MSSPTNRMAYIDIYELFDKALDDPEGLRIPLDSEGEAKYLQLRFHQARAIDRRDNLNVYTSGHPLHGASSYDRLQVSIKRGDDGSYFVYVQHRAKALPYGVEMLSELNTDDEETTNGET